MNYTTVHVCTDIFVGKETTPAPQGTKGKRQSGAFFAIIVNT